MTIFLIISVCSIPHVYLKFFKQKKETRTAAEIDISLFNGARQSYDVKLSIFGCLAYSVYPHIITHFFLLLF